MELYKNEEVAIELANVIFGIRDGGYDEPEKFEFKVGKGTFALRATYIGIEHSWCDEDSLSFGRYRTTREGAELSLKRNQRANRLEMLVEYLGGLKEFVEGEENWHIMFKGEYKPGCSEIWSEPEKVYMTREVVKKVCELLNSGAYSLEGE